MELSPPAIRPRLATDSFLLLWKDRFREIAALAGSGRRSHAVLTSSSSYSDSDASSSSNSESK